MALITPSTSSIDLAAKPAVDSTKLIFSQKQTYSPTFQKVSDKKTGRTRNVMTRGQREVASALVSPNGAVSTDNRGLPMLYVSKEQAASAENKPAPNTSIDVTMVLPFATTVDGVTSYAKGRQVRLSLLEALVSNGTATEMEASANEFMLLLLSKPGWVQQVLLGNFGFLAA